MSTIEATVATVSMLENMPADEQEQVFLFTQNLFHTKRQQNPFVPLTKEQILADLDRSEEQFENGQFMDASEAIEKIGKKHGFI